MKTPYFQPSAFILLAVFCLTFIACGQTGKTAETGPETVIQDTTAAETEPVRLQDNVPDGVTFDGAVFSSLSDDYGDSPFIYEENGEVINDAKYKVRTTAEEILDVTIKNDNTTSLWDMVATVTKLVMSGDTEYHIYNMMDRFAVSAMTAVEDIFIPLGSLGYVNPDAVYWGEGLTESLSVGGVSYFAQLPLSIYSLGKPVCMYINKNLAADLGTEVPYDAVRKGTWTYETLDQLKANADQDLNGDGIMDTSDRWGLSAGDLRSIASFVTVSCDESVFKKDDDGFLYYHALTSEKFISAMEIAFSLYKSVYEGEDLVSSVDFKTGEVLFYSGSLASMNNFRDFEDEYGMLPMPKYDEAQKNYRTRTIDSYFAMVPVTVTETDLVGAVLDVLYCEAYNEVHPAYFETSLQEKFARDEDTVSVIGLLLETQVYNIAEAFMSDVFGDENMRKVIDSPSPDFASFLAKNEKNVVKQLATLNEILS